MKNGYPTGSPDFTPRVVWVGWIDQFYSCIKIDSGVTSTDFKRKLI